MGRDLKNLTSGSFGSSSTNGSESSCSSLSKTSSSSSCTSFSWRNGRKMGEEEEGEEERSGLGRSREKSVGDLEREKR